MEGVEGIDGARAGGDAGDLTREMLWFDYGFAKNMCDVKLVCCSHFVVSQTYLSEALWYCWHMNSYRLCSPVGR